MIGTTLSHYKIESELGRGGMGIVYRATDTTLDRTVAIKVLPSAALATEDDRARFYREAKAAAALNHPNIAAVYQIGEATPSDAPYGTQPSPFIAMEFIEGGTLEDKIKAAPLKLGEAVRIATQVAEALKAAHAKEIVHRDIKSANIMLTKDGQAKVLDFGLAKTSHSTMLTRMGSTLGTVAYMSPEQARGEEVDHRTDLWALGVVLYEMMSGRNPFGGDYEQAVVYSILNEAHEPLTAVRTGVQLEWIIDKCLAKAAEDRYQSAKDLIVDLKKVDIKSGSGSNRPSTVSHLSGNPAFVSARPSKSWPKLVGFLLLGVLLTAVVMTVVRPTAPERRLTRVDIAVPSLSFVRFPTMSPTGEYLAVVALGPDGKKGIFLRKMNTGDIQFITGSEDVGDREMGFSPDGSRLAFNEASNGGLFIVNVPTDIPARLTDFGRFAYWESNDVIVMTDDRAGGSDSYRVEIANPVPAKIEQSASNAPEGYGNVLKTNVPGTHKSFGHQLVRITTGGMDVSKPASVFAFDSDSGDLNIIVQNALNPYYISHGYLLYQIGNDYGPIVVRKLDDDKMDFSGQPREVLGEGQATWGDYGVTPDGDLIYVNSGSVYNLANDLWQVDLKDRTIGLVTDDIPSNSMPGDPSLSLDGKYLAYSLIEGSGPSNIHLFNLQRKEGQQITFQDNNHAPFFSPDNKWLYWTRMSDGIGSIYRQRVDQSSPAELFLEGAGGGQISPDGKSMAYTKGQKGKRVLLIRNLETKMDRVADSTSTFPWVSSFSTNSRYLTFATDISSASQIKVLSVDGKESYTLPGIRGFSAQFTADSQGMMILAPRSIYYLPIRITPSFGVRGPQVLILNAPNTGGFAIQGNDKLILIASTAQFSGGEESGINLVWLQNWSSQLQKELDQ